MQSASAAQLLFKIAEEIREVMVDSPSIHQNFSFSSLFLAQEEEVEQGELS
jgi:hypothetical protein